MNLYQEFIPQDFFGNFKNLFIVILSLKNRHNKVSLIFTHFFIWQQNYLFEIWMGKLSYTPFRGEVGREDRKIRSWHTPFASFTSIHRLIRILLLTLDLAWVSVFAGVPKFFYHSLSGHITSFFVHPSTFPNHQPSLHLL